VKGTKTEFDTIHTVTISLTRLQTVGDTECLFHIIYGQTRMHITWSWHRDRIISYCHSQQQRTVSPRQLRRVSRI